MTDEIPVDIFTIFDKNKKKIGEGYLYCIINRDGKSYGLIEDLYIDEAHRNKGIGKKIVNLMIEEAKLKGYYKIIATSRLERENVHKFYKDLGLKKWGYEFRIDL